MLIKIYEGSSAPQAKYIPAPSYSPITTRHGAANDFATLLRFGRSRARHRQRLPSSNQPASPAKSLGMVEQVRIIWWTSFGPRRATFPAVTSSPGGNLRTAYSAWCRLARVNCCLSASVHLSWKARCSTHCCRSRPTRRTRRTSSRGYTTTFFGAAPRSASMSIRGLKRFLSKIRRRCQILRRSRNAISRRSEPSNPSRPASNS